MKEFKIGDKVRVNNRVWPEYMEGLEGEVLEVDEQNFSRVYFPVRFEIEKNTPIERPGVWPIFPYEINLIGWNE